MTVRELKELLKGLKNDQEIIIISDYDYQGDHHTYYYTPTRVWSSSELSKNYVPDVSKRMHLKQYHKDKTCYFLNIEPEDQ